MSEKPSQIQVGIPGSRGFGTDIKRINRRRCLVMEAFAWGFPPNKRNSSIPWKSDTEGVQGGMKQEQ
jgi:hypothetical protein